MDFLTPSFLPLPLKKVRILDICQPSPDFCLKLRLLPPLALPQPFAPAWKTGFYPYRLRDGSDNSSWEVFPHFCLHSDWCLLPILWPQPKEPSLTPITTLPIQFPLQNRSVLCNCKLLKQSLQNKWGKLGYKSMRLKIGKQPKNEQSLKRFLWKYQ